MARINLLPWRAERREQRKREFFIQLGIAAAAAILVVILWGLWMNFRIDNQNDRNAYLKQEIQQLDAKIAEIKDLQKVKSRLLARKQIIEKLQANRAQMVHLFDELVKTIPNGARLTSMKQQGDKLTLHGVAQSNATVAAYMRNIEASPWMGSAQLVKTENTHGDVSSPYEFDLVVTLTTPKAGADGGAPASGSSGAGPAAASTTATADAPAPQVSSRGSPPPSQPAAAVPAKPAAGVPQGGARP
jgi:type IV pilus assembly protein PilN